MDKVTCIAYILFQSANTPEAKNIAIQLLNGDISLLDLKRNLSILPDISSAESLVKKNKVDMALVQEFATKFLMLEV
jgi:hypothetical protein